MKKINSLYFDVQLVSDVVVTSGDYMRNGGAEAYDYVGFTLMPKLGMFGKAFHYGYFSHYNEMLFNELLKLDNHYNVVTTDTDGVTRVTYQLSDIKDAVAKNIVDPMVLTMGTGVFGDQEVKMAKITYDLEGVYLMLDKNGDIVINSNGMPAYVNSWSVYVPVLRELSKELTASGKTITKKSDWQFIVDPDSEMNRDLNGRLKPLAPSNTTSSQSDEADEADEAEESAD